MLERSDNNLDRLLERPGLPVFLGGFRRTLLHLLVRNPPEHFGGPDRRVSSDHQKRSIL